MSDDTSGPTHFEVLAPAAWTTPVIFNSPHSGNYYPDHLLQMTRLGLSALRKSEDCYIDELFQSCLDAGSPLLRALCARAYIDLNREPFEFDPRMFEEDLPGYMNTTSPRVAGGLGTIPRLVAEGEEIYRSRLTIADALRRVETIYKPYHRMLKVLIDEALAKAGVSLLVDCHSMPSSAAAQHGRMRHAAPDIVLGDRFGTACPEELTSFIEALFRRNGLNVVRNTPYAGGFITQNYGTPSTGSYAIQIEINRALYMNEQTLEKSEGYEPLIHTLGKIVTSLTAAMKEFTSPQRLAAE